MNWKYEQPVKIIFGNDSIKKLSEIIGKLKISRPLFVVGKHVSSHKSNDFDLENMAGVYDQISPNPDVSEVNNCALLAKERQADGIVAIGGGSVLDLAKAVSVSAVSKNTIQELLENTQLIPDHSLPLIAIPTTAGTGSEVTNIAVISNRKQGTKQPLASESLYPEVAIVDPTFTVSMPKQLTAQTGIDVLSHAIEAYWSIHHQPITDAFAIEAIKLVFRYLPIAYKDPGNLIAREKMSEAALIAGLAFNLPKTTAVHACSFPLTNRYQIAHGEACGLTLDWFVKFNYERGENIRNRMDYLAQSVGFQDGSVLAEAIHELKKELHLKTSLKEFHITRQELQQLIEESQHPNLKNNPVTVKKEDLLRLYEGLIESVG